MPCNALETVEEKECLVGRPQFTLKESKQVRYRPHNWREQPSY